MTFKGMAWKSIMCNLENVCGVAVNQQMNLNTTVQIEDFRYTGQPFPQS